MFAKVLVAAPLFEQSLIANILEILGILNASWVDWISHYGGATQWIMTSIGENLG